MTADAEGNLAGGEARNVGGEFATETLLGTWTINSDCTGSAAFSVYESGTLVRLTSFSLVFVDDMRGGYASAADKPNLAPPLLSMTQQRHFPRSIACADRPRRD